MYIELMKTVPDKDQPSSAAKDRVIATATAKEIVEISDDEESDGYKPVRNIFHTCSVRVLTPNRQLSQA